MDPKPKLPESEPNVTKLLYALLAVILSTAPNSSAEELQSRLNTVKWQSSFALNNSKVYSNTPPVATFGDPVSPRAAFRYSLLGTLLPTVTGTLLWVLNGTDSVIERGLGGTILNQREEEPDRTLSALLIWSGVTFGPSLGYFHGRKTGRGLLGFGFRNGIAFGGLVAAFLICPYGCSANSSESDLALLVFAGSIGVVLISSIYDIATVKKSVIKKNAEREAKSLSILPLLSDDFRPTGIKIDATDLNSLSEFNLAIDLDSLSELCLV